MLRSIIRLDDTTAHEIMIPRLDMVALEVNTPLREAVNPIIQSGHTRIPVYAESIDHIIGIVHSLELLKHFSNANLEQMTLREVQIHPAYFIPENKRLDDLLEEIQQKAVQMAIVVDEYGGTEGLITMGGPARGNRRRNRGRVFQQRGTGSCAPTRRFRLGQRRCYHRRSRGVIRRPSGQ